MVRNVNLTKVLNNLKILKMPSSGGSGLFTKNIAQLTTPNKKGSFSLAKTFAIPSDFGDWNTEDLKVFFDKVKELNLKNIKFDFKASPLEKDNLQEVFNQLKDNQEGLTVELSEADQVVVSSQLPQLKDFFKLSGVQSNAVDFSQLTAFKSPEEQLQEEVNSLKLKLQEEESKLGQAQAQWSQQNQTLSSQAEALQTKEQEILNLKQQVKEIEELNETIRNTGQKFQNELSELQIEKKSIDLKNADLQNKIKENELELENLKQTHEQDIKTIQELKNKGHQTELEIQNLRSNLDEREAKINSLNQEINSLLQAKQLLETHESELKNKIIELENTNLSLQGTITQSLHIAQDLETARQEIERLKNDNHNNTQKTAIDLENLQQKIDQLESFTAQQKVDISKIESAKDELERERENLKILFKNLEEKNKMDLENHQKEINRYNEKIAAQEGTISKWKREYEKSKSRKNYFPSGAIGKHKKQGHKESSKKTGPKNVVAPKPGNQINILPQSFNIEHTNPAIIIEPVSQKNGLQKEKPLDVNTLEAKGRKNIDESSAESSSEETKLKADELPKIELEPEEEQKVPDFSPKSKDDEQRKIPPNSLSKQPTDFLVPRPVPLAFNFWGDYLKALDTRLSPYHLGVKPLSHDQGLVIFKQDTQQAYIQIQSIDEQTHFAFAGHPSAIKTENVTPMLIAIEEHANLSKDNRVIIAHCRPREALRLYEWLSQKSPNLHFELSAELQQTMRAKFPVHLERYQSLQQAGGHERPRPS